jgi:hypothetical protein
LDNEPRNVDVEVQSFSKRLLNEKFAEVDGNLQGIAESV